MKRFIEKALIAWKDSDRHPPLILLGARQVGKSHLIEKNFAPNFEELVSINFERDPNYKACFEGGLAPSTVIPNIEAISGKRIKAPNTLLFLDEIQVCPNALTALRYFHEEYPELHVVAAGSLLEFLLQQVSIPVGRVSFRRLYPLSFEEFLHNAGDAILLEQLEGHDYTKPFPSAVVARAEERLRSYFAIGGMPKVVDTFLSQNSYWECQELLEDILDSYQRDFPKYSERDADLKYVQLVFARTPHIVGQPFKFVAISRDIQSKYIRRGIELCHQAGVIHPVYSSHGFPLEAKFNPDRYKLLFADLGLMQRACGLNISRWISEDYRVIHQGTIAEQFVGQQILCNHYGFKSGKLYYWERQKRGSQAELDFVIDGQDAPIPIEVKSSAIGRLRSLKLFLDLNSNVKQGIKTSLENVAIHGKIASIPLWAFGSWLKRERARVR